MEVIVMHDACYLLLSLKNDSLLIGLIIVGSITYKLSVAHHCDNPVASNNNYAVTI